MTLVGFPLYVSSLFLNISAFKILSLILTLVILIVVCFVVFLFGSVFSGTLGVSRIWVPVLLNSGKSLSIFSLTIGSILNLYSYSLGTPTILTLPS